MESLNNAERRGAFLGFLFLFLLTLALVVTVVFSSVQVPFTQNEQLRQRLSVMQEAQDFSDSFSVAMKEALDEMNKFSLKEKPALVISQGVSYKINKIDRLIKNNSLGDSSLYRLIVESLYDLNDTKLQLSQQESRSLSQN